MSCYTSILFQGKKFAKPELKACIEEFEEKLNKFHMEKEQEATAKNAELHQKKIDSFEGYVMSKNTGGDGTEAALIEGSES